MEHETTEADASMQIFKLHDCKAFSSTFKELTVLPRWDFS